MMENERFPIDMRTELLTIPNMEIWSNPELNVFGVVVSLTGIKTSCNIGKPCKISRFF